MTTLPGDASTLHDDFGADEVPAPGTEAAKAIEGRSLTQIAWSRLKRDKVAVSAGSFCLFMIGVGLVGLFFSSHIGGGIETFHNKLIDPDTQLPIGSWGGVSGKHWFGVDPGSGRDLFARVIKGAWWSLLISFLSTALTVILGVVGGLLAGYFGGWVDSLINWLMGIFLAFPVVLFGLALNAGLPTKGWLGMSTQTLHVVLLIIIIGGFGWAYFGRIIRGQVFSLREKEFVDAARSLGAKETRIVFKEMLPNLVAPILVFTSLAIPTNILAEAAFSFLGVGIQLPEPSWGGLLNDSLDTYRYDPAYMFIPGLAIFVTVLAFNLFGDGVRDAFDPKAGR